MKLEGRSLKNITASTGFESQIPLIEYSKTENGTASLVAAISKKL